MPLKGERRPKLSIGARLSMVQDVAARLADSHGLAEVTAAIRISLEAGVGAAAMVINVMSPEGTNLSTLYDSGTSERTHTLLGKRAPSGRRAGQKSHFQWRAHLLVDAGSERPGVPGLCRLPERLPILGHPSLDRTPSYVRGPLGWLGGAPALQ